MTQTTLSTPVLDAFARSEPFDVAFNPLEALPKDVREERVRAYLEFLRNRDGHPDIRAKTLSRREQFFAELDELPIKWEGAFDRALFHEYIGKKPPPDLDPRIHWLLAAAKANRVEHYAVMLDLRLHGEAFASHDGDHMTYIDLEEFYHSRILRDCCKTFDIEFDLLPPNSFTKFFAALVVRSPQKLRLVTSLCGELFGCVAFLLLWERADLFSDQPKVVKRLRLLVREILLDEMGHAAYVNAKLGPAALAIVKAISPMVSINFLRDLPEYGYLAGGRRKLLERVAAFDLGKNAQLWDLSRA